MKKSLITLALLGFNAHYPPSLFALRLGAQLSCALLLVFALFLLVAGVGWPVPLYALLVLAMALLNLSALFLIKKRADTSHTRLRLCAHISSALLPIAYVLGMYYGESAQMLSGEKMLTILAPTLINIWAVEQSAHFERQQR